MTNNEYRELKSRLADRENEEFLLEMKDHWDAADFDYQKELKKEINEIKEKMKEALSWLDS